MPEKNLASGQTLEELSIGNWFDGNELIFKNGGKIMTTFREYKDGELRTFYYKLVVDERGIVQSIRYRGGQNYPPKSESESKKYSELMTDIEDAKKARTLSKVEES